MKANNLSWRIVFAFPHSSSVGSARWLRWWCCCLYWLINEIRLSAWLIDFTLKIPCTMVRDIASYLNILNAHTYYTWVALQLIVRIFAYSLLMLLPLFVWIKRYGNNNISILLDTIFYLWQACCSHSSVSCLKTSAGLLNG